MSRRPSNQVLVMAEKNIRPCQAPLMAVIISLGSQKVDGHRLVEPERKTCSDFHQPKALQTSR